MTRQLPDGFYDYWDEVHEHFTVSEEWMTAEMQRHSFVRKLISSLCRPGGIEMGDLVEFGHQHGCPYKTDVLPEKRKSCNCDGLFIRYNDVPPEDIIVGENGQLYVKCKTDEELRNEGT